MSLEERQMPPEDRIDTAPAPSEPSPRRRAVGFKTSLTRRGASPFAWPSLAEQRGQRIREAAYLRAERRGFAPGNELEDWLDAEQEVDRVPRDAGRRPAARGPSDPAQTNRFLGGDIIDHRLGRRVPLRIPVRIRFQDGTLGLGVAMNLSREGLFVKTAAPWRSGCIDVRLTLPTPRGERTLLLRGLAVHAAGGGIGLMFRNLDERARGIVSWLVSEGGLKTPRGELIECQGGG